MNAPKRYEPVNAPKRYEPVNRTRPLGRAVTRAATPEEKLAAFRRIVADRTFAIIDGATIDLFSASAVVAVYDALGPEAQAKYLTFPAARMALLAYKLLK